MHKFFISILIILSLKISFGQTSILFKAITDSSFNHPSIKKELSETYSILFKELVNNRTTINNYEVIDTSNADLIYITEYYDFKDKEYQTIIRLYNREQKTIIYSIRENNDSFWYVQDYLDYNKEPVKWELKKIDKIIPRPYSFSLGCTPSLGKIKISKKAKRNTSKPVKENYILINTQIDLISGTSKQSFRLPIKKKRKLITSVGDFAQDDQIDPWYLSEIYDR